MSERSSPGELHRPLITALEEHITEYDDVDDKPLTVELEFPSPAYLTIYLYTLKRYERDEERFRIQPTSGPSTEDIEDTGDDHIILLMGYNDGSEEYGGEKLFAIFDPTVYTEDELEAASPNRPVGERAIETAVERGEGVFINERETGKLEFIRVARDDSLSEALLKRRLRLILRDLLEEKLPSDWNDSYQQHVSIEETAINFLLETDLSRSTGDRYQAAIEATTSRGYETDLDQELIKSVWNDATVSEPEAVLSRIEDAISGSYEDLLKLVQDRTLNNNLFNRVEDPPATDEVYFASDDIYDTIDTALRSGNHIILTGPPGAGKSHLAEIIADHYTNQYETATATDDWTTFDTIGGYRESRQESLNFRPGIFLQRFLNPDGPTPKNEWLIADELNRADIDKAFGPLFSALTGQNVTLPFDTDNGKVEIVGTADERSRRPITDHHYYIPQDWRLIATMNTDDKSSLYRLSYAFMRRFAFVNVPVPSSQEEIRSNTSEYLSTWNVDLQGDINLTDEQEDALPDGFDTGSIEEHLADIWAAIQPYRPIGPAMIQDVLEHVMKDLDQGRQLDYGPAVVAHILPQLEGTSEQDIESILESFEEIDLLSMEPVERFTDEYLGVSVIDE